MKRIDRHPRESIGGIRYKAGMTMPFGATVLDDDVVNFSVYSKDATSCTLVLFHYGDAEPYAEILIPEDCHVGSVYAIMVFDLDWENVEYGYRFDGPYDLRNGYCFDKTKVVLDPYAKLVSGREKWHTRQYPQHSLFEFRGGSFATTTSGRATDSSTRPSRTSSYTKCTCAAIGREELTGL